MNSIKVELKNYPIKVITSFARRKKYYEQGKKHKEIPKKYLSDNYKWLPATKNSKILFLTDITTKERVLQNPKAAGTPKEEFINFNSMYSGLNEFNRVKMMAAIKDYFFKSFPKDVKFTKFPLHIEYYFEKAEERDFDADNHAFIYIKA